MASQSRSLVSRWWAAPMIRKLGLIICLLILAGLLGARTAQAAPGDPLEVTVDGRIVTVDPATQAQLDNVDIPLEQLLNTLAPGPVQSLNVDENRSDGSTAVLPGVQAVVTDHRIAISGLSQQLAQQATISIWIVGSNWRICIIITWGSYDNPIVTVDGRPVGSHDVVVQNQGKASSLTLLAPILGGAPVTTTNVAVLSSPGVTLTTPSALAVVQGNRIRLQNLTNELALYGRLSIWISIGGIRICVIIEWGNPATLSARVDGRAVTVGGQEAQVDGVSAEVERALAIIGSDTITDSSLEIRPLGGVTLTVPAAFAVIKGNQIAIKNLTPELAAYGKLSIWISGSKWRICIIIVWGSDSTLAAAVDGRPVTNGGQEARINGQKVEMARVLALIGTGTITEGDLDIIAGPGVTITAPTASVVMKGNQLTFHNLTKDLAVYGKLEIWFGRPPWQICIIIIWGSDSALNASVDGRPVTVEGQEAEIDGAKAEMERVLAIIGSGTFTDSSLEIQTLGGVTVTAPAAFAVIKGNQITLSNLDHELATEFHLSLWFGKGPWRICIVIGWGNADTLAATVDGRNVIISGAVAQLSGANIDIARALDILGGEEVTSTVLQLQTSSGVTLTTPAGAQAVMKGNLLKLTKVSEPLAKHIIINIWIRFSDKLRVCVTIEINTDDLLPTVALNGRPVTVEGPVAEIDGKSVEPSQLFAFLDQPTTATKIEIVKNGVPSTTKSIQAVVHGGQITITDPGGALQQVRISIWIGGSRWRICIIISFERLTSPDGMVLVDVPAHLVHGGLDLTYDGLITPTHPLPTGAIGLRHFMLHAHSSSGPVRQLDVDYSLKVKYTASQLASLNAAENTLRLVVWDEATSKWLPIASTVDAPNDTVTGMLDHFSEFALIGDSAGPRATYLPIISR